MRAQSHGAPRTAQNRAGPDSPGAPKNAKPGHGALLDSIGCYWVLLGSPGHANLGESNGLRLLFLGSLFKALSATPLVSAPLPKASSLRL